ncbi:UNVERIFIED_CONTAM: hypothetical protein Slati_3410900 [Sesamum latifolium]|uniref:Reverse transcriptase domain-containing protein n=1 Tax=Sesamum latifolium TaxID=2727402 RepID=A0AAW2UFW7_9LAMI
MMRQFGGNGAKTFGYNAEGSWVTTEDGIWQCITSHFQGVFASSRPQSDDIAKGTEHLRQVVDSSMAENLLQPYTDQEVTKALFQMAPLKSRGLMFRPISLCNVVYNKIESKTIANRLKPLLESIISPTQSAFVPGRLISDNILLAFELNHFMNTKSKGGQGWMALKLDVSKAYDKVEWSFLQQGNRGQHKIHWIAWHRLCESKLVGGLGFQQLHLFNLAMLAKQLWRLWTHPEKLLSRVLRARYFPNGDVFSATLGSRIVGVVAAQTFRAGCRWRVGSGRHIRVWADPWLPRPRSFSPIVPAPTSLANLRVADLIECGDWKVSLIQEVFWP